MKKVHLLTAVAALALVGCANDDYVGQAGNPQENGGAIMFQSKGAGATRADYTGATAADLLGNNFIVEGTKGTEADDAPTNDVVFDNYKVEYTANTAGTTASNTHNWEYVGLSSFALSGITGNQTIKYWDYSQPQYDFVAYSTGKSAMITTGTPTAGEVLVTAIDADDKSYEFNGAVADLKNCYITDITEVMQADYNKVVTLKFKNLTSKVRLAIYETIPGYSVKDVQFYTADYKSGVTSTYINAAQGTTATLFTSGTDVIPQNGTIAVSYPLVGNDNASKKAYNKASVEVTAASTDAADNTTKLTYGSMNYVAGENVLTSTEYLGRTLLTASFAGSSADNYYTAVLPNNEGKPLTLRVNYTLKSNDGSGEEITVYGAKAVVPATYTAWQPNYAYTYIFKIADNTNGWTSQTVDGSGNPQVTEGLHPITFDAVVVEATEAEQTTVTTVATPSITTYQQGHTNATNEYSIANGNKVYVQVMNNSTSTPSLVDDLDAGNALLFELDVDHTEALVLDALQYRKGTELTYTSATEGRNNVVLTKDDNIDATVTKIQNGVNDEEIDLGTAGKAAAIDITQLTAGKSYAFVYQPTTPSEKEAIYQPKAVTVGTTPVTGYYKVAAPASDATALAAGQKAVAGKVYFRKNTDANGENVTWTFVQTRVNDDVEGLYEGIIPASAETSGTAATGYFYFDVYYKNDGEYAVKVIKVVA